MIFLYILGVFVLSEIIYFAFIIILLFWETNVAFLNISSLNKVN